MIKGLLGRTLPVLGFVIATQLLLTGIAHGQDSAAIVSSSVINQSKSRIYKFHGEIVKAVVGSYTEQAENEDAYEGQNPEEIQGLYMVETSPYSEVSNKIAYLIKAYGFTEAEAMAELGIGNREEMNSNIPVELFEFHHAGSDGIMKTADDKPLKSLMRMKNGDLSSRFYLQNGSTILVQTIQKSGVTNGILKNENSVPLRGYMIKADGATVRYHYDLNGRIVLES